MELEVSASALYMKSPEHYLNQLGKAFEESILDYQKGSASAAEHLSGVLDGKQSKYQRVLSFLKFVRELAPDIDRNRAKGFFYDTGELPFDPRSYRFDDRIGSGGENTVYLLESQAAEKNSFVLKVTQAKPGGTEKLLGEAKKKDKNMKKSNKDTKALMV